MSTARDYWSQWGTFAILEEWGLWCNQRPNLKLTYPKMANFARMMPDHSRVRDIHIDDDLAVFVCEAVNDLGERREALKIVVVEFFVKNRSAQRIGRDTLHCDRRKVSDMLRSAEAWIDGRLYEYFRSIKKTSQGH